jgi:hypothetical protein
MSGLSWPPPNSTILAHHHPYSLRRGLQARREVGHLAGHHELIGGARCRDGLARGHTDGQAALRTRLRRRH